MMRGTLNGVGEAAGGRAGRSGDSGWRESLKLGGQWGSNQLELRTKDACCCALLLPWSISGPACLVRE